MMGKSVIYLRVERWTSKIRVIAMWSRALMAIEAGREETEAE
jgi:hypothetical protein